MSDTSGNLEGRVAVVTGASRGIGRSIATALAVRGAHVVLAARTLRTGDGPLEGGIAEAAEEIEAAGGRALAIATDITDRAAREALVRRAAEELGPVDILVNNAAVTYFQPFEEMLLRRFDLMLEVQVRAPFHLMQLVIPEMKRRSCGWILNISSIVSQHPAVPPEEWHEDINGTVYGMCKAALERMSSGAAAELYQHNVAVNSLAPNRVVPTPGTVFHHLTSADDPEAENIGVITQAALILCSAPPQALTGRNARSADLLAELSR
jgi:NAD(P)-dependent dehydrogenase (short-subunit alcohol dehydrogenase family)